MNSNKAIPILLVALRIVIGWHFLYEGLFKIDTASGGEAYQSSRYHLQSRTVQLREDLLASWSTLDPQAAVTRINAWHESVEKYFQPPHALNEEQKTRLAAVRDTVALAVLDSLRPVDRTVPDEVEALDWMYVHEEVLRLATEQSESPRFSSLAYLQGSAGPLRGLFRGMVPDIDGLERLRPETMQARLDARYEQLLRHYASAGYPFNQDQRNRLAAVRDELRRTSAELLRDSDFEARLQDYRLLLDRVKHDGPHAATAFEYERLDASRKKLDEIAGQLLSYVDEPLIELTIRAVNIATVEQMRAGQPPPPPAQTRWIDLAMEWGLVAIGLCLLLGLFTPMAAFAAAAQLLVFYLASPPWPGLPAASLGGHYMYIDRNLIEMVAALGVAFAGTGWAGLDAYLERLRRRSAPQQTESTPAGLAEAHG
jgi:uncharacterized membrane protein YphA (DoxX/SURF4 family)